MGNILGNSTAGLSMAEKLPIMAGIELLTDKAILARLKAAAKDGKGGKINDGGGLLLEVRPKAVDHAANVLTLNSHTTGALVDFDLRVLRAKLVSE